MTKPGSRATSQEGTETTLEAARSRAAGETSMDGEVLSEQADAFQINGSIK